MPVEIKMPALSPTMEEGTLAKWLVKEGDKVSSGDLLAEIETDKATMEFESIDEGTVTSILVAAGTENVKVGQVIAIIAAEGEDASAAPVAKAASAVAIAPPSPTRAQAELVEAPAARTTAPATPAQSAPSGDRIAISPLAKRLAEQNGIDISTLTGTGPGGRLVKADIEAAIAGGTSAKAAAPAAAAPASAHPEPVEGPAPAPRAKPEPVAAKSAAPAAIPDFGIPHEDSKLSTMRKVIARRLAESMQEAPHIYLTLDVRLDALLKLRSELNASLAARNIKLSVNDMLIKALAVALEQVPQCNVSFGGDTLRQYHRADISVAVSIPGGLITPIITNAGAKSISAIATEMADLAARAKTGKLQPAEFQGGTASISNMGMMGIKQFTAVINPPQAMILAVGAGEKRPYIVDDALAVATVMTCTGSFDHRAIDGADGAQLMAAFKTLVENPLGLVA